MFIIALVPMIIGLPIAIRVIPSSKAIEADVRRREDVEESAGFGQLLGGRYRAVSIWFAIATFVTLLAWYGLGTWLPRLMETAGCDFGAALMFTLALNLGAVIGSVTTAWAGDRFGPLITGVVAAGIAGVALLALLAYPPVWLVYLILIAAGVGTHGTQILIIAAITGFYPHHLRGTALGWSLGIGRLGAVLAPQLAGWLLAWGLGVSSNFVMFGMAALLSAASLLVLLRVRRRSDLARPKVTEVVTAQPTGPTRV